jgi:hypothetical protein
MSKAIEILRRSVGDARVPATIGANPLIEDAVADYDALAARLAEAEAELAYARSTGDESALEVEQWKRDAARYRWIRSPQSGQAGWWHIKFNDDPAKIDAAIDAAMAAETVSEVQK